jgi:zinc protease
VEQFHKTYFVPANAGLVLVGDFDPKAARERIRHYFEGIPAGTAVPAADVSEPARTAERRENLTDSRIQAPTVLMVWNTPSATDPDWFAVKRLGEVLGASEAARLQTALVKGAGVAAGVQLNLEDTAGPNLFAVILVVAPGKDPAQAEKLALQEMDRISREGVTQDELDRFETDALRRRALQFVSTVQRSVIFAIFQTGYQRLEAVNAWEQAESKVTSEDVRRVAQKYFTPANRSVIVVTPEAKP